MSPQDSIYNCVTDAIVHIFAGTADEELVLKEKRQMAAQYELKARGGSWQRKELFKLRKPPN